MTDCADCRALIPPEAMVNYMPEVEGEKEGVYDTLINTYAADTIEELGEKLGLTDVAAFAKTVARYNELCALGVDEDMGKAAKWLKPIVTPPFYGIHRRIGLSTIIHGVNVNADMQVLDTNAEVIPGLYAAGNCGGSVFAVRVLQPHARHGVRKSAHVRPARREPHRGHQGLAIYQHPSLGGAGSKPAPLSERDAEAPSSPKCSTASINSCWECTSSFM